MLCRFTHKQLHIDKIVSDSHLRNNYWEDECSALSEHSIYSYEILLSEHKKVQVRAVISVCFILTCAIKSKL